MINRPFNKYWRKHIKVLGLDKKEYDLDVRQSSHPPRSEAACKSKIQFEVGELIKQRFPHDIMLEELYLPGSNKLYLDFLLPSRRLGFEIQGQQHSKFVEFFHKTEKGFAASKQRDSTKNLWCEINNIELFYISSLAEAKEVLGING